MSSETPAGSNLTLDPKVVNVMGPAPIQTRSEWRQSAHPEDFSPVTGREPEWRLSPVRELEHLISGALAGGEYPLRAPTIEGVEIGFVAEAQSDRGQAGLPENRLTANAWSQVTHVLRIGLQGKIPGVVRIARDQMGGSPRAAHTVIRAHSGSEAVVVVESTGRASLAENVEVIVEEGATLQFVSVQRWDADAIHYAAHSATVAKDAQLRHVVVNLGGRVVVVNPSAALNGDRARGELYGLYFADHTQHLEHRVYVHHVGPDTVSEVTYKGALHGKGARTVWVGDVLIGEHAVGTDSYEQNRNLVLSDGTRADSIPNLEIKTGNIKGAGHASATGRFDDNHLFYLQSRGIPEITARRLVVQGFLADVIQRIDDVELRQELLDEIQRKLRGTEGNGNG